MNPTVRLSSSHVPAVRVHRPVDRPVNARGRFVLYWMQACRRATYNFSLQRAVDWAVELDKPLVIVEDLPCGHRWDSRRRHRFVLDGMAQQADAFRRLGALYYPFVESQPGDIRKFLVSLVETSCIAVTDEYPLRRWTEQTAAVARDLSIPLELVDSNGLLPLRATDKTFTAAHSFRRFLQRALPEHLLDFPRKHPISSGKLQKLKSLPATLTRRWPPASDAMLGGEDDELAALPIDQQFDSVGERGGHAAAAKRLRNFLANRLSDYSERRNDPDADAASGLSPYLHFGHLSVHEVFRELARREAWSPAELAEKPTGSREGWWGMSAAAEAFLDELVTWREIGFNFASRRPDYDQYESLPDWAKDTLAHHARDRRAFVYSLEELKNARTHDPLWNAAQRQLVREGRIHNYLRMLWGKKILEWTENPGEALETMIELNNKYALDGEDPNSYSGIFWVLGRYDRPWGPERKIFGKIRYMSSENTARKLRVANYLKRYA